MSSLTLSKFSIQEAKVPATEKEVQVTCAAGTEDYVQEELKDQFICDGHLTDMVSG